MAKLKVCKRFVNWVKTAKVCHVLQTDTASVTIVKNLENTARRVASIATSSDSNLSSRLWIERMVAGLNHVFEITTKPELVQALSPVRKISLELQQYCVTQFPDYLQDLQNDLRSIEYLQHKGELDASALATSARFLLDQLRQDCSNYSTQHAVDGSIPRNEEQWQILACSCDLIATWMKQTPPSHELLPVDYLTRTIQSLGAFEAQFPNRIPVKILENLISLAQKEKLSASVNNEVVPSAGASNSNKRPRTDSDETGPELKRPRPRDPFDPVKLIVARFGEVALKVKMLVSSGNEVTNRAQEMGSAVGEMKVAATAAINGVTELLEHPDYHGQDIVTQQRWNGHHDEFSVAYSCAESQVCVVAAHHIRVDVYTESW